MPYKCHLKDGTKFDYTNPQHIKNWDDEWYLDEKPEERWTATDVHAATTIAAGYSKDDPNFKSYRTKIGKRTNFAKNYGAQLGKIKEMYPDKSDEECQRINDAYYKAFPGVKNYHQYCYNRASYSYTVNMFGVKYYNVSGHKLINMLVQGSAAYYLKQKLVELDRYIQSNHLKTRMQMNIHDEVDFEVAEGEQDQLWEFKRIMEDWPEGQVPIVADPDWSTTNWAEKKELQREEAS
jgi:DNA polymerase-1